MQWFSRSPLEACMIWGVEMEDQDNDKSVEKIMRLTMGNIRRRKEGERYDMMDVAAYRSFRNAGDSSALEDWKSNWLRMFKTPTGRSRTTATLYALHRRVIGKPLVRGRELIHGEVRRYVDPMIEDQNEFNSCVCRVLNEIANRIEEIYSGVLNANWWKDFPDQNWIFLRVGREAISISN